jgi:hypothetical protein
MNQRRQAALKKYATIAANMSAATTPAGSTLQREKEADAMTGKITSKQIKGSNIPV